MWIHIASKSLCLRSSHSSYGKLSLTYITTAPHVLCTQTLQATNLYPVFWTSVSETSLFSQVSVNPSTDASFGSFSVSFTWSRLGCKLWMFQFANVRPAGISLATGVIDVVPLFLSRLPKHACAPLFPSSYGIWWVCITVSCWVI